MATVKEISRVRFESGFWLVQILSAATGRWITQGEWRSKAAADADRKNWM